MTINSTVHIQWELDGTVSFSLILESGEHAAKGSHVKPAKAARDIGSALLLEADQDKDEQLITRTQIDRINNIASRAFADGLEPEEVNSHLDSWISGLERDLYGGEEK